MFKTDDEILERLKSPDNLINRLEIHKIERGRLGAIEVPIEIKKTLAILSNEEDETQKSLGNTFQITHQTVQDFKKARTSYQPLPELQEVIDKVKGKKKEAETQAIEAVLASVGLLTPDRLSKVSKAKDIASIAKDMAVVADKMGEKNEEGRKNVHLHLYAPNVKQVEDYEIIDVVTPVQQ